MLRLKILSVAIICCIIGLYFLTRSNDIVIANESRIISDKGDLWIFKLNNEAENAVFFELTSKNGFILRVSFDDEGNEDLSVFLPSSGKGIFIDNEGNIHSEQVGEKSGK